jgi:choline kinase
VLLENVSCMTAVIPAAGVGSRLRPLTATLPKCLLPVGGVTLLERTLGALAGAVQRAVIVTGFRHELVRAAAASLGLPFPLLFVQNSRFEETNNNYSLWLAGQECAGEEILILDSDILFHRGILSRVLTAQHENALALRESGTTAAEDVKVCASPEGRVLRIGKEVPPASVAGESVGIERFSAEAARVLFGVLDARKELDEFYEASFQEIIDGGTALFTVPCGDLPCIEIDTPEDLREAERLVAEAGL